MILLLSVNVIEVNKFKYAIVLNINSDGVISINRVLILPQNEC